jgi:hypothetical protein
MQHFTLHFPRRTDELYDNLEPHLRQIVQLHLESLILKCYDYTSRPMDLPWQIGSVYNPLLCQQEKDDTQEGDKVRARSVVVRLAHALTASEASIVQKLVEDADSEIVSRMKVLPD